jgi:hypothetical protein
MGFADILVLAIVALLILWFIFAAIKKWRPGSATGGVGGTIGQVADTTQAWTAYAALTSIRYLDSVEADPKAVEACDYLRQVVTSWKRPSVPTPTSN